uniref:Muscarinic acetylcholine receptor n=1 Tax=Denticeps clupeoides TaxID=299321 RepID=A0AAY4B222_9TELE
IVYSYIIHMSNITNSTKLSLQSPYSTAEVVIIALGLGTLSLVTVIGNILVILSIKVNRNLQTVNNYFLFSLACADLVIGLFSMNLYTVYIVIGYWPLGPVVCDLWLALDYVMSNASVMNLLIISFDRYFCITKPLSYPVSRTTKIAGVMIAAAWIVSFILWAPAILFWQFIVGERTVPEGECYIQFFSNAVVTFGTAIAAFYLPVVTMIVLYWQISRASRSRVWRNRIRDEVQSSRDVHRDMRMQENGTQHTSDVGTEDATTGEDLDTENESTSGSVLASSNYKDGEGVTANTNGRDNPGASQSKGETRWSKLTCVTVSGLGFTPAVLKVDGHSRPVTRPEKVRRPPKRRKPGAAPLREKKVTRTIMAILLAFIVTWTPYNVMVLINTFCTSCVPGSMWTFGYLLCYINSTVNPACYALCNITFKNTFKQLLFCRCKNVTSK